jgi:hypothetical protein
MTFKNNLKLVFKAKIKWCDLCPRFNDTIKYLVHILDNVLRYGLRLIFKDTCQW